jgi:predicted Zn-dependent protease with MMP-like domain
MSQPETHIGRAPSIDDFAAMAEAAFDALPEEFRRMAGDVIFRVEEFPSDAVLSELEIDDPFDLTGLYSGAPIGLRDGMGPAAGPSMIFLYRRPILDEWAAGGDVTLTELIAHVLVHEIGNHFGLDDDDIEGIEARAG